MMLSIQANKLYPGYVFSKGDEKIYLCLKNSEISSVSYQTLCTDGRIGMINRDSRSIYLKHNLGLGKSSSSLRSALCEFDGLLSRNIPMDYLQEIIKTYRYLCSGYNFSLNHICSFLDEDFNITFSIKDEDPDERDKIHEEAILKADCEHPGEMACDDAEAERIESDPFKKLDKNDLLL